MKKKHARGRGLKQARWVLVLVAVGTCAAFAGGSAQALAAETHVFNAELSLSGACTSSEIDPVPDPGCPEGAHPPSGPFSGPRSVTADRYGDIFVAGFGSSIEKGRVDVFNSSGLYLTEVAVPEGPLSMAIDSECHLYVFTTEGKVERYDSSTCEPGKLEYGTTPTLVAKGFVGAFMALAVDRANDHLFVHFGTKVAEYSSAAEGNKEIGTIGGGFLFNNNGIGLAVDAAHGRIYASDQGASVEEGVIRVFDLASPHALIETIDGSTTPEGRFRGNAVSIAVDEATGHVFAYDGEGANVVYEFTEVGAYVSTIEHEFRYVPGAEIAIDNGAESPNGALNPDGRFLFVPSHPTGIGHSFAFGPMPKQCPPGVEALRFSDVTEADAQLEAKVNPCNLETSYTFEYTTQQQFEEEGFAGAIVAGEGQIPSGEAPVEVSAPSTGLSPETTYRFRLVATNEVGEDAGEGEFTTYPVESSPPCPNDPLRTGLSALLPDCRAYELVTPGDTNGRTPQGVDHLGVYFATREASPAGDKVSFQIEGGLVPGSEGTGSYAGDPYLSTRGEAGWTTSIAGPNGEETSALLPGSTSPDQGYSFWSTGGGEGTAGGTPNHEISYVRYPDGHSALVGRGSLADDPEAESKLISENGGHIIFLSHSFAGFGFFHPAVPLEENSPPEGTGAIYDRTANEVTHVVSLLPGDVTPAAGENAFYEGASLDGEGVAFRLGEVTPAGPLYFRYHNAETFEFGENATFAGFSEGAKRIFYLEGGDLFAFDIESEETIRFSASGDVTVVNVAAGGTSAYFVSPSVLTGEANPNGATPEGGKENLYRSQEGMISFVGVLLEHDVVGDPGTGIGLDRWAPHVVSLGEAAEDPSRTTPDGTVIVFESRASLTGYDPEGHVEVYRYDSAAGELTCPSCNPTQAPASGNASLESVAIAKGEPEPFSVFGMVNNLSLDGRRAFFQSTEALVADDTDGLQDVYEWEAQGVGTCNRLGGCVYLISSGNSNRIDYLYAASDSGNDVFFRTSDRLLHSDSEGAPSIYDARVGGGFPEPAAEECQGEGCRPGLPGSPALPVPQTAPSGATNLTPHPCRKGTRKVTRHGKARCVKKHHRHRKAGSGKKGAGK